MSRSFTPSMSCFSEDAGSAPAWLNTMIPSRKAISVGIAWIPAIAASCCSASVSTFANVISSCSPEAFSYTGANCLHGPHQSAQKSTSTIGFSVMVCSKDSVVTSTVGMGNSLHWGLLPTTPARMRYSAGDSGHRRLTM